MEDRQLTWKDLERAVYPLTLVGKGFRRGQKLIINKIVTPSGGEEFKVEDGFLEAPSLRDSPYVLRRTAHLYKYWYLEEQPYDPLQNGDTDEDI